MAILAHPDDESLGFGGTLAKYSSEGVEVFLLTATRGEKGRYRGEHGPNHPGPDGLARLRESELRAAAEVLGIREVSFLGYSDQQVDQADTREIIGRIAKEIRRVHPDVVVTFGPDGGYGHPDHIGISQAATAAIVAAADPGFGAELEEAERGAAFAVSKLYYLAWSTAAWAAYQAAFKKLVSVVDDVERQAVPWPDWMITTTIDTRHVWDIVWRAVSCHDSQIAGYARLKDLAPEHHQALWGSQSYCRVFSLVNGGRQRETDLFDGVQR
jgi:LmbE family N-acetylglucosaminyl deacetylase